MPVKTKATIHEFTIVLANVEELTPNLADALYSRSLTTARPAPAMEKYSSIANRGVPVGRTDQRRIDLMAMARPPNVWWVRFGSSGITELGR